MGGGDGEARGGRGSWYLPEVVEVQLLSAVLVWLTLSALASRKLKLASRSGQKGSMANLSSSWNDAGEPCWPAGIHVFLSAAKGFPKGRIPALNWVCWEFSDET